MYKQSVSIAKTPQSRTQNEHFGLIQGLFVLKGR